MFVDEREDWGTRLGLPRDQSRHFLDPPVIRSFELGQHLFTVPREPTKLAPWEHIWVLTRGGTPVPLLDTTGRAVTHRGMVDMMALYQQCGRRLEPVVHGALGHLLP